METAMTENSAKVGTSKYIVGEVKGFDQKNEGYKRSRWDPIFYNWAKKFWGLEYPKDADGYTLLDQAFKNAAWHIESGFAHGNIIHNTGMYSWDMNLVGVRRVPPGLKLEVKDQAKMSKIVKKVAKYFGASLVGICKLDQRWVYSHTFHFATHEHQEFKLPKECDYAIVMAFEMDYELVKSSPTWQCAGASGKGYSTMAFTASMLAQFIRGLGYKGLPSGNDSAINIPLAIDAGLGELGRNGLLITPEYGPRARICKVFTDLPLAADEPIEFGVLEFCTKCKKCAKQCPGQAIMYGEMSTKPHNISNASGQLKWPINVEKCFAAWSKNEGACMNCI